MSPPYHPSTRSMLAPHCEPRREGPRERGQVLADVLARFEECRGYVIGQMDAIELDAYQQALRRREQHAGREAEPARAVPAVGGFHGAASGKNQRKGEEVKRPAKSAAAGHDFTVPYRLGGGPSPGSQRLASSFQRRASTRSARRAADEGR